MQQSDQRCAHSRQFGRVPRLLVDSMIRRLNRSAEPCLRLGLFCALHWRSQVRKKRIRSEIAGNLSRSRSPHTVADHVGACLWCGCTGILVAMADTAAMGEHCVDKVVRRHSWSFSGPNKTIHVETADTKGTLVLGVETLE